MRRYIPLILILALLCFPALAETEGENLIVNGDFEALDGFGLPEGWSQEMYYTDASELSVEEGGPDGGSCVLVVNRAENDARFAQDVPVEPDTLYQLSCLVRAEDCGLENNGASISVRDTFAASGFAYDTDGEWIRLECVGRTGPEQTSLGVLVRVGGYSSVNTGKAWFDDVRVVRLDEVPDGAVVQDFTPFDYSSVRQEEAASDVSDAEPARNTEAYALLTFIYALVVLGIARKKRRAESPAGDLYIYIAVLAGAFLVRLILALRVRGYNTDITCFEAWSERIFSTGIGGFYSPDFFCDYPPAYMVMLWPAALLRRLFGAGYNSPAHILLIKSIPIVCDLIGAHLVYRFARERLGGRPALLLAAFYALNPAVFVDSAAWGQIDSVLTLLVVICAIEAVERRYLTALPVFALAVLVKPQALLFGPLGLAAVLLNIVVAGDGEENPGKARLLEALWALAGVITALMAMYLFALPFSLGGVKSFAEGLTAPVRWLYNLYSSTLSSYPYFSLNTLNVWTLFGMNWCELSLHPGLEALSWGLFIGAYAVCVGLYLFSRDRRKLYLCAATLLLLVCTFGPKIHERYVYPALILLVLAYITGRDVRVLISATALTVTLFLNQVLVLQGALTTANYGHLHDSELWLNAPLSAMNIAVALLMLYTCVDLCVLKHSLPLPPPPEPEKPAAKRLERADAGLRLVRWDYLIMAGITCAYAIVAFVNLGSITAPQTSWVSAAGGEQLVFDLGERHDFRMIYYGGISDSAFTVELSNDGETWTRPWWARYNQGEIFRWIYYVPSSHENGEFAVSYEQTVPTDDGSAFVTFANGANPYPLQTARYVRLTAEQYGLVLSEVAFLDPNGAPLPIRGLTRSGLDAEQLETASDPMLLIDEQTIVPAAPSYYNSSYFDEIYHARTAYEHLHGLSTYEWTHPPLGKVLMMVGVQIFGMTPFGWRFMGTLMGVLMLPVLYLMVKQLTKRTDLSAIATFLMAVDAMHFTQTRIATIDSYAVFFIMAMYLFMFRYSQMGWYRQSFARTLIPLGLSGLFMGFAWATKWIGLYASVGLAVIFFWSLAQRLQEYPGRGKGFGLTLLGFVGAFGFLLCACLCAALGIGLADALYDAGLLPGLHSRLGSLAWWLAALVCFLSAGGCLSLVLYEMQKRTEYQREFWSNLSVTIAFCLVMFIAVPVTIYYFSYYWQLRPEPAGLNLTRVIGLQRDMLNYHAGLSGDTHWFRSPWYQWPVIAWPMWYYSGNSYQPAGVISSISCMGNPAVFWTGLAALLFIAGRASWLRKAHKADVLVLIGFASQFLPWVLVPRSTFIYHYFASVPFIIIATALALDALRSSRPDLETVAVGEKRFRVAAIALCAAALVLFIAFYPLESGTPVARAYANWLRWFNWYNF